jgi:uncharacterized glyoxalase superfamily protein PhnB
MSVSYKPASHASVAPYLLVTSAAATIDFLARVFDSKELMRMAAPDGRVMHAEVRIDDTVVMVGEASEGWPPMPAMVHVYIRDADETYRRALAAGATSVQEPMQKGDADKRGGVKDADGISWWMATRM